MAVLPNETKNLRFFLDLVDREVLPLIPGRPPPSSDDARLLGTTGVEFFDRRDQAFWPFIRLPVIYLNGTDGTALVSSIRDLCAMKTPGFVFRAGVQGELALQLARHAKGFIIEVGLDLAAYLLETSGVQGEIGRELALFRFHTTTAELVKFADSLKQDLEKLPPPRGAAP